MNQMGTLKLEHESERKRSSHKQLALLLVSSPGDLPQTIALEKTLRIGRSAATNIDIALDDPAASGLHARIEPLAGGAAIYDEGSTNGTFVDGVRVTSSAIRPGAVVRMGRSVFVFDEAPPQTALESGRMLGRTAMLLRALEALDRAAPLDVAVLLVGETGTGKELAAERIHQHSGRTGRFVAVNCAALSPTLVESTLFGHVKGAFTGAAADAPGLFAEAAGGTLFLDEIGELPLDQQAKLLRVLETHEFTPVGGVATKKTSARFVSATNAKLTSSVSNGRFRRDLFARISTVSLELPPLRARRGDIFMLAQAFSSQLAGKPLPAWSETAIEMLLLHPWPMNVRELRNVVQRLALERPTGLIEAQDVTAALAPLGDAPDSAQEEDDALEQGRRPDRLEFEALLARHQGNVSALAEHYGRERRQIYRWIKHFGIDPNRYRASEGGDGG